MLGMWSAGDAKLFTAETLEEVANTTNDPADRENVSLYIYEHPEKYKLMNIEAKDRVFKSIELNPAVRADTDWNNADKALVPRGRVLFWFINSSMKITKNPKTIKKPLVIITSLE